MKDPQPFVFGGEPHPLVRLLEYAMGVLVIAGAALFLGVTFLAMIFGVSR